MAATFGDLWRKVSLQASAVPPLLVRAYTQDAYQEATQGRRFSWMRRWYQPTTVASRTLDITATAGSVLIQGAFVASDLNRQVRSTNQGVPYTIVEINPGFTEATLDTEWAGTGGSLTVTILSAFLFLPENFDGCRTLSNLTVQQPMPWWYTSEQLDFWDPNRIWADSTARIIAARGVWSGGGTMDGRQVYEWWPYPSATAVYQMSYYAKLEPADDERLQGQFATRNEVIETGALARCAMYPGTAERKNPYFNLQLAQMLEKSFQESLQEASVRDEDTSPAEEYNRIDWRWVQGLVPMDTHLLRSTDATLASYYGGNNSGYSY